MSRSQRFRWPHVAIGRISRVKAGRVRTTIKLNEHRRTKSRENLRRTRAKLLGSRITSRIAVIISRGRAPDCQSSWQSHEQFRTRNAAPSLFDCSATLRRTDDKKLRVYAFLRFRGATFRLYESFRLVYVQRLIKSTLKLRWRKVGRKFTSEPSSKKSKRRKCSCTT